MGKARTQDIYLQSDKELTVTELRRLYSETLEQLKEFSEINPKDIDDLDEIENAEAALLDFESYLLGRASKMPLKTDEDVTALIDIWAEASSSTDDGNLQSNKIVKNIFGHFSRKT